MTMDEYIKKDDLLKEIESTAMWSRPYGELYEAVQDMLAADVAPVRHGRWKCHGDCGVTECSVCGWRVEEYVGDYAYCPNCGAKMDGERKNENL